MMILNRKDFLARPANTVFSKYTPCIFGPLCIKGATVGGGDFEVQQIADAIQHNGSDDFFDSLNAAEKYGECQPMDFDFPGRDGLFDEDQLFAVWQRQDVEALINRLQRCL